MEQKKQEQRGLIVGVIVNLLMGLAGLWVYRLTGIEALSLDAYFTLIAVTSTAAAIIISKISSKTSPTFPNGLFMLEPLYAILKSGFSLFLLVTVLINTSKKAFAYFIHGTGVRMNLEPIIPYTVVMVLLCFGLYYYYSYQNKRINNVSTMLNAEAKGTLVDGFLSGSIGIAALSISFIPVGSPLDFFLYTGDFFITALLFFFSIKEPISILKKAFIELSGGTLNDRHIQHLIENSIQESLSNEVQLEKCTIYKVGMSFRVFIELEYSANEKNNFSHLLEKKKQIRTQLKQTFPFVQISFILTE